jgi:hypothetical protein
LANEHEAFGWLDEALEQINIAHTNASDRMQKANAYWAEARLNGKKRNLGRMRELYLKAINEFKTVGMSNTAASIMQAYAQWIGLELINGDCPNATESHRRMSRDIQSPDVWPAIRSETGKQFNLVLSQSPRTCDLPGLPETNP